PHAKHHNKLLTKHFNQIPNIIKHNPQLTPKNPPYPISYTTTFLKHNPTPPLHNNTHYIHTTTTQYSTPKITL
ncbi:thiol-activated cytolysin family protein, partial [Bacillus mycoides]|uniref:thiol-activated cytolysin family protein n=1 Tax=Bacillus mycoides TaxID=1405 RepID=UPI001642EB4B